MQKVQVVPIDIPLVFLHMQSTLLVSSAVLVCVLYLDYPTRYTARPSPVT